MLARQFAAIGAAAAGGPAAPGHVLGRGRKRRRPRVATSSSARLVVFAEADVVPVSHWRAISGGWSDIFRWTLYTSSSTAGANHIDTNEMNRASEIAACV